MPTIKTGAEKFFVDVPPCSTLNILKESIAAREGVPISQQMLIFAGRQLRDGSKLLSDYNVTKDADVVLLIKSIDLSESVVVDIRSLNHAVLAQVSCRRADQISLLLERVSSLLSLSYPCTLLCQGHALDPRRSVHDYQICNGDALYILQRIVVQVERKSGEKILLQVCDPSLAGDIAEMVANSKPTSPPSSSTLRHRFSVSSANVCSGLVSGSKRKSDWDGEDKDLKKTKHSPNLSTPSSNLSSLDTDSSLSCLSPAFNSLTSADSACVDTAASLSESSSCRKCRRRVGLGGIKCRCGGVYCARDIASSRHRCPVNYRELHRVQLLHSNPRCQPSTIQPIL